MTNTINISTPISLNCVVYENGRAKQGYIARVSIAPDNICRLDIELDTEAPQTHTEGTGRANEGKTMQQAAPGTPSLEDSPCGVSEVGHTQASHEDFEIYTGYIERKLKVGDTVRISRNGIGVIMEIK